MGDPIPSSALFICYISSIYFFSDVKECMKALRYFDELKTVSSKIDVKFPFASAIHSVTNCNDAYFCYFFTKFL